MTDAEVKAAMPELFAVALTLFGEARGEPVEGRVFVGSVIRNRVSDERWPDSFGAVVFQRLQFSCWWKAGGEANYERVMRLARLFVDHDHAEPRDELRDPVLQECIFIAEGTIGGQLMDNSRSSNHYMTKALFQQAPPKWAKGKTPVVEVGAHLGFKL